MYALGARNFWIERNFGILTENLDEDTLLLYALVILPNFRAQTWSHLMNGFGEQASQGREADREDKRRSVQKFWFSGLTEEEQDRIIRPHFEAANPTDGDKRQRTKEYEEW